MKPTPRQKDVVRFARYIADRLRRLRYELGRTEPARVELQTDAVQLKNWSERITREFPGHLTETLAVALREAVQAVDTGVEMRAAADRAWDRLQEWEAQAAEVSRG